MVNSALLIPCIEYQRMLRMEKVSQIAENFSEYVANEPKVSYRDGRFYVFDGQNTEFGGAVAQVVSRAQADGQHLCDLLYRVHQCCGFQAVSRRKQAAYLAHFSACEVLQRFPAAVPSEP